MTIDKTVKSASYMSVCMTSCEQKPNQNLNATSISFFPLAPHQVNLTTGVKTSLEYIDSGLKILH